jgi:hypothetical protein
VKGRALTDEHKRAVLDRILAAWVRVPDQRLTQLIVNATGRSDPYHVEDEAVADAVESFANTHAKKAT